MGLSNDMRRSSDSKIRSTKLYYVQYVLFRIITQLGSSWTGEFQIIGKASFLCPICDRKSLVYNRESEIYDKFLRFVAML